MTAPTNRRRQRSALETAEATFLSLAAGPAPMAIHGAEISRALPQRPIPLTELRRLLLDRSTDRLDRDAAWRELVHRARLSGPSWTIAAVGMAYPALRRIANRLAAGYDGDPADVDGEALTGFLAALPTVDTTRRGIVRRLCGSAERAGARFLRAEAEKAAWLPFPQHEATAVMLHARPWGHPDFLIESAVAAQVLTAGQAHLITSTRLDGVPLEALARRLRISRRALLLRRHRAERRLVAAVLNGELASSVFPDDQ